MTVKRSTDCLLGNMRKPWGRDGDSLPNGKALGDDPVSERPVASSAVTGPWSPTHDHAIERPMWSGVWERPDDRSQARARQFPTATKAVSYTHLRAHATRH